MRDRQVTDALPGARISMQAPTASPSPQRPSPLSQADRIAEAVGASQTPVMFYMAFGEAFTGGPRVLVNLLEEIDRHRFAVTVISNKLSPMTEALSRLGVDSVILPLDRQLERNGGQALRAAPGNLVRTLVSVFKHNKQVGKILYDHRPQVLWVRNIKGIMLTGLAALRSGTPVIWDIGLEPKSRGLVLLLHLCGFLLCAKVVAEGESVFRSVFPAWLLRIFRRKLLVNRSGISADRVKQLREHRARYKPDASGRLRVLNVGSVTDRKNQLMLVRALSAVADPAVEVQIVGPELDRAYSDMLRRTAKEQGVLENIRFLGWQDDIPRLVGQADVLVSCSKNEGVPYVLLEAMHASVPIIATRCGGVEDIIGHAVTGELVEIDDWRGLANAIRQFQRDRTPYLRMSLRASEYVGQHHSVISWCRRYEEVLSGVASAGRLGIAGAS
jgi:glycosyltransferase involved in cell wall biosynthesis